MDTALSNKKNHCSITLNKRVKYACSLNWTFCTETNTKVPLILCKDHLGCLSFQPDAYVLLHIFKSERLLWLTALWKAVVCLPGSHKNIHFNWYRFVGFFFVCLFEMGKECYICRHCLYRSLLPGNNLKTYLKACFQEIWPSFLNFTRA